MKSLLFILAILLLSIIAYPASSMLCRLIPQDSITSESKGYIDYEIMPKFRNGGVEVFRDWVYQNVLFSNEMLERKSSGKTIYEFVIDEKGFLTELKPVRLSEDTLVNRAVEDVLLRSPVWIPGTIHGKPVRVKFTIPVELPPPGYAEKR